MLWTDVSNAQLFRDMFSQEVCWAKNLGGWYIYNGKYWQPDDNNKIRQYQIKVYEKLMEQMAEFQGDNDALDLFAKHVKNSGSAGRMDAMLTCAHAYMGISNDQFDADPNLFNCNNGTINLLDQAFQKFCPKDYITKISPVDFRPGSACPVWEKFIDDVFLGNRETINFIQRAIGYSMTTSVQEHCMFIFYGLGRNGKTTFINTISKIFGMYSLGCPASSLTKKQNQGVPNDIARLKGARMVTSSENNQNVVLDESVVKQLTGDDRITARFLNKEFFDYQPTFKIFLATNHKPDIRGTDEGIWRRIRMIPFDLNLTSNQEDQKLTEKLNAELPGILLWCIEGFKRWRESGLQTPQKILDATKNYRDEEDDIGQFIEDHCLVDPEYFVPIEKFNKQFKDINNYNKNRKLLSEYMRRKGFKPHENRMTLPTGEQVRVFNGITLKISPYKIENRNERDD